MEALYKGLTLQTSKQHKLDKRNDDLLMSHSSAWAHSVFSLNNLLGFLGESQRVINYPVYVLNLKHCARQKN